jgi:cell division septum initiation protein DivIVA
MTKRDKIKKLIEDNEQLEKKIKVLENVIKDFHEKMNGLLTFCKIQDRQTETEILQSKFNNMYQDND